MDIAKRFETNPILRPADVPASRKVLRVECVFNPGAFRWRGRIGLLMRVAERPVQRDGVVAGAVLDGSAADGIHKMEFDPSDGSLDTSDPRLIVHGGCTYLSTLSHLRLAWSTDGERFEPAAEPTLVGCGPLERYGIEDCRVTEIDGTFYLTYTQVSAAGVGVGLAVTRDWREFDRHGTILPPANKDCVIFDRKLGGEFVCLHRPAGVEIGGPYIWLARSKDLIHWGRHECVARTRPGRWDEQRIGAGAAPVRTEHGWLEIYHGADGNQRYGLGAMLLDLADPARVLARSEEPIMEPVTDYEREGFFGNVVFTCGHVVDGDRLTIYYGAADRVICGAHLSIRQILHTLGR